MKFLKAMALVLVKAVGYPFVMAPMALLHGVGMFCAGMGELIGEAFKNIVPILASPITVPIAVGKWAVRNRGSIALFPFASLKVASNGEMGAILATVAYLYVLVPAAGINVSNIPWSSLAKTPLVDLPGSLLAMHQMGMIQPMHYVSAALIALLTSNVLVGLYMAGRVYHNWLTSPAEAESEAPEAKVIAPQSHLTMFSKIQEKERVSEEEAWTLLKEAAEVGANGKMKLGDMESIAKMISARAPTPAVVH